MNTIIYPKPQYNFKVYKRRISLYYKLNDELQYVCSSNAYSRCKDIVAKFKELNPTFEFKAFFQ